jgi:hypothetical protein
VRQHSRCTLLQGCHAVCLPTPQAWFVSWTSTSGLRFLLVRTFAFCAPQLMSFMPGTPIGFFQREADSDDKRETKHRWCPSRLALILSAALFSHANDSTFLTSRIIGKRCVFTSMLRRQVWLMMTEGEFRPWASWSIVCLVSDDSSNEGFVCCFYFSSSIMTFVAFTRDAPLFQTRTQRSSINFYSVLFHRFCYADVIFCVFESFHSYCFFA